MTTRMWDDDCDDLDDELRKELDELDIDDLDFSDESDNRKYAVKESSHEESLYKKRAASSVQQYLALLASSSKEAVVRLLAIQNDDLACTEYKDCNLPSIKPSEEQCSPSGSPTSLPGSVENESEEAAAADTKQTEFPTMETSYQQLAKDHYRRLNQFEMECSAAADEEERTVNNRIQLQLEESLQRLKGEEDREKRVLAQVLAEKAEHKRVKEDRAAVTIQKTYRGHSVRKKYLAQWTEIKNNLLAALNEESYYASSKNVNTAVETSTSRTSVKEFNALPDTQHSDSEEINATVVDIILQESELPMPFKGKDAAVQRIASKHAENVVSQTTFTAEYSRPQSAKYIPSPPQNSQQRITSGYQKRRALSVGMLQKDEHGGPAMNATVVSPLAGSGISTTNNTEMQDLSNSNPMPTNLLMCMQEPHNKESTSKRNEVDAYARTVTSEILTAATSDILKTGWQNGKDNSYSALSECPLPQAHQPSPSTCASFNSGVCTNEDESSPLSQNSSPNDPPGEEVYPFPEEVQPTKSKMDEYQPLLLHYSSSNRFADRTLHDFELVLLESKQNRDVSGATLISHNALYPPGCVKQTDFRKQMLAFSNVLTEKIIKSAHSEMHHTTQPLKSINKEAAFDLAVKLVNVSDIIRQNRDMIENYNEVQLQSIESDRQCSEENTPGLPSKYNVSMNEARQEPVAKVDAIALKKGLFKIVKRHRDVLQQLKSTTYGSGGNRKRIRTAHLDELTKTFPDEAVISQRPKDINQYQIKVLAVADIPECTLQGVSKYANLVCIEMIRCKLSIIDGLDCLVHLKWLDVQENSVEDVDISYHQSLVHVNIRSNLLQAAKCIYRCPVLQSIDMSNNSICKLGDLTTCQHINQLNLSHNQLISTKGIGSCPGLLNLDISFNHLTTFNEAEHCPLLTRLNATGNSIMQVPVVSFALLRHLDLSDNDLSSTDGLSISWLPLLQFLSLASNRIEKLSSFENLFSLSSLDVSSNLLTCHDNVERSLQCCHLLNVMIVEGNPLAQLINYRQTLFNGIPSLTSVDKEAVENRSTTSRDTHEPQDPFLVMCLHHNRKWNSLDKTKMNKLSNNDITTSSKYSFLLGKCDIMINYFSRSLKLALEQLKEHEGDEEEQPQAETLSDKIEGDDFETDEKQQILLSGGHSPFPSSQKQKNAALIIQAAYRGFVLRKKLEHAKTLATADTTSNSYDRDSFDYDEEVDLMAFELSEDDYGMLPSKSSETPSANLDKESHKSLDMPAPLPRMAWGLGLHPEEQPRRQSTVSLAQSASAPHNQTEEPSPVIDSTSRKSTAIIEEWGFKNSTTAELMMKRARRMRVSLKPGKQKPVKLTKAHSTSELVGNKSEMKKKSSAVDVWSYSKDESTYSESVTSFGSQQTKMQATYSWVYNQTVVHSVDREASTKEGDLHPIDQHPLSTNSTTGNLHLPPLDPIILAGRSLPLISSLRRGSAHDDSNALERAHRLRRSHSMEDEGQQQQPESKSKSAPSNSKRTPARVERQKRINQR